MNAYLFAHGQACMPAQMHRLLNDTEAVATWVSPFPYAAILISRLDVHDIAADLRHRLPGVWFMVTELNADAVQGWLPKDLWEYVTDPSQAWSRQLFAGLEAHALGQPPPASPPATPSVGGFVGSSQGT